MADLRFPLFSKNLSIWLMQYIGQMLVHRGVVFPNQNNLQSLPAAIQPMTAAVTL
jgi:hypothetical protein